VVSLLVVAASAVVAGSGSLLVPRLVGSVPEPEPDPEPTPEPKEPCAAIAALPGLGLRSAIAGGATGALLGWGLGATWPLVVALALVPVSVALAVIDWRTRLLPTRLIAPTYAVTVGLVLVTWLAWSLLGEDVGSAPLVRALVGWAGAGGLYLLLWLVHPRGMGYGDVRLSGVLGIVLGYAGWAELVVGVYGGFLLGGVLGGLLSLLRRVDRKGYPFGPFMLLGALVGLSAGRPVIDALLS
jgi:leader peptidase (prepilin peptidase)/N-methyltransferase